MTDLKFNKGIKVTLLFFFMIGLISCNKDDDNSVKPAEKKIIIGLLSNNPGYLSGNDTTIYSTNALLFDRNDYAGITSATLVLSNLSTQSPFNGSDINAKITVDLVDLTNNQSILGSSILTDNVSASSTVSSQNFLNNLPNRQFNLGIRIINPDPTNCSWSIYAASLVLQR